MDTRFSLGYYWRMADAIARLLDPYRTVELVGRIGTTRQTVASWKYGAGVPAPGWHDPIARALAALRGSDDPAGVADAKAEVEAAYREDLAARSAFRRLQAQATP